MILHRLLWRFARHRDDPEFYRLQATDAIRWLQQGGVTIGNGVQALDLGCGHGVFGRELAKLGCEVTFADEQNYLLPELSDARFLQINLDRDEIGHLGRYDLVVCSNVLEHLSVPRKFLISARSLLKDEGQLYLSWTNWLSPWGGHEFSPWHYLGPRLGPAIYDRFSKRKRFHQPGTNLFVTHIGEILRLIRQDTSLDVARCAPRYYTELSLLMRLPGIREVAAWNCALLLRPSQTKAGLI